MSTLGYNCRVLDLDDLLVTCRFLKELRKIHSEIGIEHALDHLYEWVHGRIGEGRIDLVSILARTMSCQFERIDLAIGILSSSNPLRMSEVLRGEWSSLWERAAHVLTSNGKDPERCLPMRR